MSQRSITRRQLQLTRAKRTLDYSIPWCSLHPAHIVGHKERGANVIAADVS